MEANVDMQVQEVATNVATKVEKFMSVGLYKQHLEETRTLKAFHKLGHEYRSILRVHCFPQRKTVKIELVEPKRMDAANITRAHSKWPHHYLIRGLGVQVEKSDGASSFQVYYWTYVQ